MTPTTDTRQSFDVAAARRDFPILDVRVHGRELVYLDNAATSQKPRAVLDAVRSYYEGKNSNVHRGVHYLSEAATDLYEGARERVRGFLNAADVREIVFVRGTTEAINLVCHSWGRAHVGAGDEVLISAMEHHSNIVPWQMLCREKDARLKVIPMDDRGDLLLDEYRSLLTDRTRIVAVNHVSNALGTVNPVADIVRIAHERGVPVLVDGAQAVPHLAVDVTALGCDFYAFSGPQSVRADGHRGALRQERDPRRHAPVPGGRRHDQIGDLREDHLQRRPVPLRGRHAERRRGRGAGGRDRLHLRARDRSRSGGTKRSSWRTPRHGCRRSRGCASSGRRGTRPGVISFTLDDVHPHDIGTILDAGGIAVRTGHHCAQPVMQRFGVPATVRASFGLYNTTGEVDALVAGLGKVKELFR